MVVDSTHTLPLWRLSWKMNILDLFLVRQSLARGSGVNDLFLVGYRTGGKSIYWPVARVNDYTFRTISLDVCLLRPAHR